MPESDVNRPSSCGGKSLMSLWAQPPPGDELGWYLFNIIIPIQVKKVRFIVSYGIRDGIHLPYDIQVKFQVKVNSDTILNQETNENHWFRSEIEVYIPDDRNLDVYFITKSLGRGDAHGAVWGAPVLLEVF